ncbi:MAG TPA: ABC transporter substrate-binding protein [Aliidongia sp.]|nr:ABC transporter substrate-binding protein [Aliidongia sp.]
MRIARRTVLSGILASPLAGRAWAAAAPIRIGVLRFGTVSWEVDVIRRHGFDTEAGIAIEPVELAGAQATQVALQAKDVDMIVVDWLWVSRQRAAGADWTFTPFSNSVGAVMIAADSPIRSIPDLAGKRLGIAGSPIDKSWLILRAYAQRKFALDLDAQVEKSFAAAPLLDQELKAGRLDAALTYWPFAAKAEAAGMRQLLAVEDAIAGLGIGAVPIVGYVFSEHWAEANSTAVDGFLGAVKRARDLLAHDDAEWQRLAPIMGAGNAAEQARLVGWYRRGIPQRWGETERRAADQLYQLLAETGGPALVGSDKGLAPGTFWPTAAL